MFEIDPLEDIDGMKLITRIAFDTIPSNRRKFIEALDLHGDTEWSEVKKRSKLPNSTINWIATELLAQDVIERFGEEEGAGCVSYRLSNEMRELCQAIKVKNEGSGTKIIGIDERPKSGGPSTT